MSSGKHLAAICPLCQHAVVLGPADQMRDVREDEATLRVHLGSHSVVEWAQCVQELRNAAKQRDHLQNIPYWAMPHA